MSEYDIKLGEMIATIKKLEEYHSDYVKNIEKYNLERESFYDMMNELTTKFSTIIVNQKTIEEKLDIQSRQIRDINDKDRNRIIIAGWIGSVLLGIGAFIYAQMESIIQFIIFYYHKTTDK